MHRPRRRGARPPLLELLAALLLAARGAAAQGKRRIRRLPILSGPRDPSVGQLGAGQTGSTAPTAGGGRRNAQRLANATAGAGAGGRGFALEPGCALACARGPCPRRPAAVVSADRKRGGMGAIACCLSPHFPLDPHCAPVGAQASLFFSQIAAIPESAVQEGVLFSVVPSRTQVVRRPTQTKALP